MSDAGMKCPYCGKSAQVADHVKNGVEAARVLADFAETAPGRLPGRVQDAIATVRAADNRDAAVVDADEDAYVIEHMGKLLAEIAVIVNGPEPALTRWSYHDLPDKVRALKEAPDAAPAGEAVVIGYRPMEGKATISWHGSSNPDWVKLGTKLYTHPPAAEVREVAWRHPDEVPKVVPGGNAYFWVAVRRKHDGRVYSFPAQYLNAMLLCNEWSDDTERSGNRYHHGPTCEVEGSFPATGWHDAKEHGEYDCVYQPLLGDADELVAWREVADYPDTAPPAPVQAAHPSACELGAVRELPAKWRQRAEQKISASQHASIEQKCIVRFRADDELARANELEAALRSAQEADRE